ncbi:hypothetical protein A5784_21050 [Mycobacterium sp. 852013-50091_SCH5140682]|nr:hypothetical protein A5784_21050 [Mycobacterium sp. 852013-50091_SCH5140682]
MRAVVQTPGQPLDINTRRLMESRFGRDFSRVRVHTDPRAAASAEAVAARAYTVGPDVVFAAGQYGPGTERGLELLAHELAHTIQQDPRSATDGPPATGGQLETSADVAAGDAVAGRRVAATLPTSGLGLACAPADDERAKAVAEAEAVARNDDEAEDAPIAKAGAVPSMFSPGGFTDAVAAALLQKYESHNKLLSMALTLAERQARRREFWDGNPSYNDADLKEAFALDLYWDPKEEGYIRQPYVSQTEKAVLDDPEARSLYSSRLWDLTENKQETPSRFTRGVHWVCEHTEPCASNLEQFRKDREGGMSRGEALNRGMARLAVNVETMALPTPGPRGPIALGPGSQPPTPQFTLPEGPTLLPEGATAGGGKTSAPPAPDPMLTTGSKSGGTKGGPVGDTAVPETVVDEPTNPIRQGDPTGGEKMGDFRIYGEKRLKGNTFERDIYGLKSIEKPTTARGVGPLLKLFKSLLGEARAAGATKLRITGRVVVNENILEMGPVVEKMGGTFRQVDAMTVEIEIPVSQ